MDGLIPTRKHQWSADIDSSVETPKAILRAGVLVLEVTVFVCLTGNNIDKTRAIAGGVSFALCPVTVQKLLSQAH